MATYTVKYEPQHEERTSLLLSNTNTRTVPSKWRILIDGNESCYAFSDYGEAAAFAATESRYTPSEQDGG